MTSKLSIRQILSKVVIDNSPVKLSGDRMDVRVRETNLAMLSLMPLRLRTISHTQVWTCCNNGGLWNNCQRQQLRVISLPLLPFGNSVAQIQVTGQKYYDMLLSNLSGSILRWRKWNRSRWKWSTSSWTIWRFPQVSGARVYYDTTLPAENVSCQLTFLTRNWYL